jgi:diguanylate cyclase (GGDEF)-like protein
MSVYADEALAVQAVRQGAQDYLVKGTVTADGLGRALHYAVERHRMLALLRGLSLVDDLTGLYNRRGFASLAASHLSLSNRMGRRFHLVFGDLDGLKQINDTHGHQMGDAAIRAAADILRATFRQSDVLARLGGDEFVVLALETTDASEGALLARLELQLDAFNAGSGLPFMVGMTAGVVAFDADQPHTLEEVLARADDALYARKRARRAAAAGSRLLDVA